jgi:hypothetical protein
MVPVISCWLMFVGVLTGSIATGVWLEMMFLIMLVLFPASSVAVTVTLLVPCSIFVMSTLQVVVVGVLTTPIDAVGQVTTRLTAVRSLTVPLSKTPAWFVPMSWFGTVIASAGFVSSCVTDRLAALVLPARSVAYTKMVLFVFVASVTGRLKVVALVAAVTVGPLLSEMSIVVALSVVPETVIVGLLTTLLSAGFVIVITGAVRSRMIVRVSMVAFPALSVANVVIVFEPVARLTAWLKV